MSVDASKLRKDAKITLKDGTPHEVCGCYMSAEGIIVTVKASRDGIVDRNVPLADIEEVVADGK